MSRNDWFRNTEWNEEIESAFFARLARARSQRDQYLVIQAITLAPRVPQVAIDLVDIHFATRKSQFHDASALCAKAEAYLAMGKLAHAIQAYKDVLAREAEFPNLRTTACLDLPYLVAVHGVREEYDFVLDVLEKGALGLIVPVAVFKWHAANALIAHDRGQRDWAAAYASAAIEAAKMEKSGLPYHPNIGLVGNEYQNVVRRLTALASLIS